MINQQALTIELKNGLRVSLSELLALCLFFGHLIDDYVAYKLKALRKVSILYKIIRLKRRYIFTKKNTIRLRYIVGGVLCLVVLAIAGGVINIGSMQSFVEDGSLKQQTQISSSQTAAATGVSRAAKTIKKTPKPTYKAIKIGSGDTVIGVLEGAGLSRMDAHYTVQAMSEHYDLRRVKPGQKIDLHFKPIAGDDVEFDRLSMKIDPAKFVHVVKEGDEKFNGTLIKKKVIIESYAYSTEIETSLYGSAARANIPPQIIAEIIRLYSWNVDFQRDIRRGDIVKVLYDTKVTEDGDFVGYGDVLFASLSVGGKSVPIYRYEMKNGRIDYFQPDGRSIRKTLMKTPIDGARLSSGFGMRKHPVLGYNKMHKGLDFAAPTGTPIYAAGDGTIDFIGRRGGYGNYIMIRHNSKLKTAYAHMHKYARGMSKGKRVSQGDVIGYVGTTGRSTGPHLHYEVHTNGKQVNPRSVNLPTGEELTGEEKKRFLGLKSAMDQQYNKINGSAAEN